MTILIHNISEERGQKYGKGEQHYVLCINNKKFIEFIHNFEDGLSECLRRAADAFQEMQQTDSLPIWQQELYVALLDYDGKI
jgi:hypothetical protein